MKQCPICGRPVADNVELCPNCGGRISANSVQTPAQSPAWSGSAVQSQTPQQPAKRGPSAAVIAAIAAVVAAAVLLGVLLLLRLFSSPKKQFIAYQQQAFVTPLLAVLEREVDIGGAQAEFPSTDMTLTMDTDSVELQPYLENTSLVMKVDTGKDRALYNAEVIFMDHPLLSAVMTYDSGRLGFSLPDVDSSYYIMDLNAVVARLYGQELDMEEVKTPEFSGKEWTALIQTYLDIVNTAVTENNVTLEKRQTFTLEEAGASYTGNVYTFAPTAADIEATLNALADHLEADQELRSLILKLVDEQTLMAYLGDEYSSLDDALDEAAVYLRSNAAQLGKDVEDSGFTWTLYMERKTLRMIRWSDNNSTVVWESAGDDAGGAQVLYLAAQGEIHTVFRHDYRKDGKNSQGEVVIGAEDSWVTIDYSVQDGLYQGGIVIDNEGQTVTLDYRLEVGEKEYKGFLTMSADDQKTALDFRWNRETHSALGIPYGSYTMRTWLYGEEISITLEVAAGASGGTDHVLTVHTPMSVGGISWMSFDLHTTDEKSTAVGPGQTPVDITDYSEEELSALFEDLSGKLYEQVFTRVYAALGGG